MPQTCVSCEDVLSCSDSALSTTGNIFGILTFAYAILVGTLVLVNQFQSSSADMKRFAKSVAFLRPQLDELDRSAQQYRRQVTPAAGQGNLNPNSTRTYDPQVTIFAAAILRKSETDKSAVEALLMQVHELLKDFQSLLKDARYLLSDYLLEDEEPRRPRSGLRRSLLHIMRALVWVWKQGEMKERLSKAEANLGKIRSNAILRTHHQVEIQVPNTIAAEDGDNRCLADLRLTDPRDDKTRIELTKGGLREYSYEWIFQYVDFQQWRGDYESQLLWIKGDAGKGKTMLLIGIIKQLWRESNFGSYLVSFFFCQRTDSRLNNATGVLRGLIYLLIMQKRSLISHVRKRYDHVGRPLFEDANAFYALSEIIKAMLKDPDLTSAYLIVDALDECENELPQLLDLISQTAVESSHIKWLVSSRNRHDIERRLRPYPWTKLSLELNEDVSRAVDVYIDYEVSQLTSLEHNRELQFEVRDRLREKANGTFLWVALAIKKLQEVQSSEVLKLIVDMPRDLSLW